MTDKKLTYQQRCFIWASGHYLGEEVDETFWKLDDDEKFEYLEENAWQPFEDYAGKDIYQYISQLAWDIENKKFPMENNL